MREAREAKWRSAANGAPEGRVRVERGMTL